MSGHLPSRIWFFRLLSIVIILSMLIPPRISVQAEDDLTTLIKEFETSLKTAEGGSREAALKIMPHYQEYKHLLTDGKSAINHATVVALDNQIIGMCQETWREVALKEGSELSYVVPVGTLGTRDTKKGYIPGKSDKDFIPQGTKASEAVQDFNTAFQKNFNISPEIVDVNALDPTKIETWPDRLSAAENVEKYNTKGGINWLENQLYKDKPNLWRYDTISDAVGEVPFLDIIDKAPPPMTAADAIGFASDNLRFREGILNNGKYSEGEKAFKTAKYDIRTLEAYTLAGGTLTAEERKLFDIADVFRNPPGDTYQSAIEEISRRTGMSSDEAIRYYLEGMETLNGDMTKKIASSYLDLMGPGRSTTALTNELAAAIGNMPERFAGVVETEGVKFLGKAEFNEIKKFSEPFRLKIAQVQFGTVYFNEQSLKRFGVPYDKLSDAEKATLHGAAEVTTEAGGSFLSKTLKVLGETANYAFAAYAIYDAYETGNKRGTAIGLGSAACQAFIELLEMGSNPLTAMDILVRLTAGAVKLGASAYKNDVLDTLYEKYKKEPNRDISEILDTLGVQHYNAGGLRELAKEIRAENPKMTDAQIDAAIEDYFKNRIRAEADQQRNKEIFDNFNYWIYKNDVHLSSQFPDNEEYLQLRPKEYYKAVGRWLQRAGIIKAQLNSAGINLSDEEIYHLVNLLFNRGHEEYINAMRQIYADWKVPFPVTGKKTVKAVKPCEGIACLKLGAKAVITPKTIPPNPGSLWSGGGGFQEKGVDEPCDPSQDYGPIEVQGGARAVATIDAQPPVPNTWSLYNANTSMHITFAPKTGSTYGISEYLAGLAGQVENSVLSQEFDIPGPGQIRISFAAPRGSGPLTGSCYGQSFSAAIKILKMNTESSARSGTTFETGDRVTTSTSMVVMVMEDGTKLMVHPNSSASFDRDSSGRPVVKLEKGRIQFESPKQGAKPIVVKVGEKTILRNGTNFIVRNDGDYQTVSVVEGSISVNATGSQTITVDAGKELDLVSGALTDYEYIDDNRNRMHNIRLSDLFIGDTSPEPAGTITGPTTSNPMDNGWIWQDPGYDTKLVVTNGQVGMTVPHGKCMGNYCDNTPILMHKVTGDFDLQTRALLIGPNDRWVTLDFIVYAPDSFIGLNSKQEPEDSLLTHTRIVGAGWDREWGRSMLKNMNQAFIYGGQEVPDKPVLLRLTRRGDLFRTYWSLDNGKSWNLSAHDQIEVPETLYTGWMSVYGGQYPGDPDKSQISLSDIKLTGAPLNSLPNPDWDFVNRQGIGGASGKTITLKMPGAAIGDAWAYRSEVFEGDFELVASYQAEPWDHQPGESRGFNLAAETMDGNKVAYVGVFQNDYNEFQFQTNFNIGGVLRGSWQKMKGADFSGRLKLVRLGSVIQAFVEIDDQWVQIDKGYADIVTEPVVPAVNVFNNLDSSKPANVRVNFTIEELSEQPGPQTTNEEPSEQPAVEEPTVEEEESVAEEEKPEVEAERIFSDDFSKTTPVWKVKSGASTGTLTRKNGGLNFTVSQPNKYLSAEVPWNFDQPVQDVTITMTATVQTPLMGDFGLFCRVTDKNEYSAVMMQPNLDGYGEYRFYKGINGKTEALSEWKYSEAFFGGTKKEQIEFSCIGDTLSLKVNGKLVDEVTDSDVNSGKVVLYALSLPDVTTAKPYKITFDDFAAQIK